MALIFGFWIYLTTGLVGFGGLLNPLVTSLLLLILVSGTLLGQAGIILAVFLDLISVGLVVFLEANGHLPHPISELAPLQNGIAIVTTLLGSAVVMYLWHRSISKAMDQARSDLAERHRAEADLRKSEGQLRSLLTALPDVIIIFSPNGNVLELYSGRSKQQIILSEETVGKSIHEFMPESAAHGIKKIIDRAVATANVEEYQYRMPGPAGMAWFESRVVAYDSDGETQVLWVAREVTKQKMAEAEIRDLNVELEQRVFDRTAELETVVKDLEGFTYTVSHDLRAPLRGINGFAGILDNEYKKFLPSEGQGYLNKVQYNARKMGELIDDLLEFSRLGRKQLTKIQVNLAKISEEVLQELEHELADRKIIISIQQDMPPAFADADLIKRVLYNLIANSIKFTLNQPEAIIEIGAKLQEQKPVYFVKDNGVGFDMKYTEKIFGVFQRLHDESTFEGTGVGLAIVQRIIAQHGGRVWTQSALDEGATFYFTLQ